MRHRPAASAPAEAFCQAIKTDAITVQHAGVEVFLCRKMPYTGDERLPVGPRLGIASVSYLDATAEMPLIDLLWYAHFASAVELCKPDLRAVEIQIDDRCGVQRQHLAENQATNDGDAQRPAQLGASARAE